MKNSSKTAVHFGAGNIGRGFIGASLQDAGYRVIFADVNENLLKEMRDTGSYRVLIAGKPEATSAYQNFSVLNSKFDASELTAAISQADILTASVGASVLPHIAEAIAKGIAARKVEEKLIVMACENAVNATDILAAEISKFLPALSGVTFCNTAVDRIVPQQEMGTEPDVIVEEFSEWVIEAKNLGSKPHIPSAKFVKNLQPYIERKLFTVNTAHCSVAYLGFKKGFENTGDAIQDPQIKQQLLEVLAETSQALQFRHKFDSKEQQRYVQTTVARLENPLLNDSIMRVGRDPLRKLSLSERIVSPAATLSENGVNPRALMQIFGCALQFENDQDQSAVRLHEMMTSLTPGELVTQVSGIESAHPLFDQLLAVVDGVQNMSKSKNLK